MPAIEAENLRKTYVSVKKSPGMMGSLKGLFSRETVETEAVKSINLNIEQGEFVGFLGPNGAGKTTTLKMLSGILFPTSGRASVLGYTPSDRRQEMLCQISLVMGNKQQLWWDLPAWDSFVVQRELYGVEPAVFKRRVDHLIEALELSDKIHTQVRKLSLGERMKCELVAALLYAPRIVFLDEPTLGLDVVSQKRIREFLRMLHAEEGGTFLLTSHYMQDVQELCERVIIIDHGSLVFEGTLDALAARFSDSRRIRLTFSSAVASADVERYGRVLERTDEETVIEVPRSDAPAVTAGILEALPVIDLSVEPIDIEEVIRDLFEHK
jgi:ABC-2 type transport system ATP-binding protein